MSIDDPTAELDPELRTPIRNWFDHDLLTRIDTALKRQLGMILTFDSAPAHRFAQAA